MQLSILLSTFKDIFIFLSVLGVLIMVHELGHFLVARRVGVRVERFSIGFGFRLFSRKKRDTEYVISAIPLGGYVKLAGDNLQEYKGAKDEYYSKSPGQRAQVIFAGPLFNYILGFLLFSFIFFLGYPNLTTKVGGLREGFGAQAAGIKPKDRILAIDGKPVKYWEQLQRIIQEKKEADEVLLLVERDKEKLFFKVRIRQDNLDDTIGGKRTVGLLGITPDGEFELVRYGFISSFLQGANRTWFLTVMTYKAFWRMLSGRLSVQESVTGPLGVFYVTSKSAKLGLIPLLHLLAILSVSLAIFNLLPLPILDGGHILLLGLEKLRGKTISLKAERWINQVGITIILSLALFVTFNDIARFFGDKIVKFLK